MTGTRIDETDIPTMMPRIWLLSTLWLTIVPMNPYRPTTPHLATPAGHPTTGTASDTGMAAPDTGPAWHRVLDAASDGTAWHGMARHAGSGIGYGMACGMHSGHRARYRHGMRPAPAGPVTSTPARLEPALATAGIVAGQATPPGLPRPRGHRPAGNTAGASCTGLEVHR